MKIISKLFNKGFWEQLYIILRYGDNNYPSILLWTYWKSYVGNDCKTYYDNKGILKSYLFN